MIRGSLDDLTGDSMALGEAAATRYGADVGSEMPVWFPDGTARRMRVVAVLGTGFDINSIWMPRPLLADHNGPTAATMIHALPENPDATAEIERQAKERGLQIESSAAYKSADPTDSSNMNGLALQAILGTALIYVAISLITTAAITTASRRSELALLRLAGATPGQVSKFVVAEAAVATGIGGLLGMAVALIVTLGMERAAAEVSGPVVVAMPWALLFAIWGFCTVLAGVAALLSCLRTQRPAPHTLIA
jgi:putative ABC transport system permease protein